MKTSKFNWNNAAFPFIMAFLAFICFVLLYLYFCFTSWIPYYFSGLLLLLPTLIFLYIAVKSGKSTKKDLLTLLLIPILLISSVFYTLILSDPMPISNPKHYQRIRSRLDDPVFEVFPTSIPGDAKDISFYFFAGGFTDYEQTARLDYSIDSATLKSYQATFFLRENKKITDIKLLEDVSDSFEWYIIILEGWSKSLVLIDFSSEMIIFYGSTIS